MRLTGQAGKSARYYSTFLVSGDLLTPSPKLKQFIVSEVLAKACKQLISVSHGLTCYVLDETKEAVTGFV